MRDAHSPLDRAGPEPLRDRRGSRSCGSLGKSGSGTSSWEKDRIFHLTRVLTAISGAECRRGRGGGREKAVTVGRDGLEEKVTDGTELGLRRE